MGVKSLKLKREKHQSRSRTRLLNGIPTVTQYADESCEMDAKPDGADGGRRSCQVIVFDFHGEVRAGGHETT